MGTDHRFTRSPSPSAVRPLCSSGCQSGGVGTLTRERRGGSDAEGVKAALTGASVGQRRVNPTTRLLASGREAGAAELQSHWLWHCPETLTTHLGSGLET